MATDYTALDAEILAALKGGSRKFDSLAHMVRATADCLTVPDRFGHLTGWRVVDRRLQALRKRGLIVVDRKTGWSLKA